MKESKKEDLAVTKEMLKDQFFPLVLSIFKTISHSDLIGEIETIKIVENIDKNNFAACILDKLRLNSQSNKLYNIRKIAVAYIAWTRRGKGTILTTNEFKVEQIKQELDSILTYALRIRNTNTDKKFNLFIEVMIDIALKWVLASEVHNGKYEQNYLYVDKYEKEDRYVYIDGKQVIRGKALVESVPPEEIVEHYMDEIIDEYMKRINI